MKEWLIRRLAPKLLLSEKTLEAVINHQFQSTNEALLHNKTVEISGFGKFYFNDKKALKRMRKLEDIKAALERQLANPELNEQKKRVAAIKLNATLENITALKPKIDEAVVPNI